MSGGEIPPAGESSHGNKKRSAPSSDANPIPSKKRKKSKKKRFTLAHSNVLVSQAQARTTQRNATINKTTSPVQRILFKDGYQLKGLWDLQNNHIPRNLNQEDAIDNVVQTFRELGFELSIIHAYCTETTPRLEPDSRIIVEDIAVTKYSEGLRDDVDNAIEEALLKWGLEHEPPAPLLAILGDRDYIPIVKRLTEHGFLIILAYNDNSQPDVQKCSEVVVHWERLVQGQWKPAQTIPALSRAMPPLERPSTKPTRRGTSLRVNTT